MAAGEWGGFEKSRKRREGFCGMSMPCWQHQHDFLYPILGLGLWRRGVVAVVASVAHAFSFSSTNPHWSRKVLRERNILAPSTWRCFCWQANVLIIFFEPETPAQMERDVSLPG